MNIYINNKDLQIPKDETCYIIAKNGMFLKKKLDLIESLTPVDKISFLEDIPTYASLDIPKIPIRLFGSIVGFFREVEKLYSSEAIVLLMYNKEKKTYKISVPDQEVSAASLSYTVGDTLKDHILIGSVHSHSSMSAFHSGTDVGDEAKFDGIHMTLGKMDKPDFFDLCASIAVNGLRVSVTPEQYVEGLELREYTNYFPHMFKPEFELVNGEKVYKKDVKTSFGYTLSSTVTSEKSIFWFNKEWLKNVKEKKYTYEYDDYSYENGYYGGGWEGNRQWNHPLGYRWHRGPGGGWKPNYNTNRRYIIRNGKLIEITDEPDTRDPNRKHKRKNKHQSEDKQSQFKFEETKASKCETEDEVRDCCCNDCVHRYNKIKLEELNKLPDETCKNNYQLDYSLFDYYK
jgi:hypothetical protein